MPKIAAEILRRLDMEGLLGNQLIVVGTHALYGYEAQAGVFFHSDMMATQDIDLMLDTRRRLSLAAALNIREKGIVGLLRSVDATFTHKQGEFRAMNDDGYYVDLIRPAEPDEFFKSAKGIGDNDLVPVAIMGLQWLMNAPRFESVAIAEDGMPVQISSIDPRVYAIYKQWLATKAQGRDALKKRRDRAQALAVAEVASEYLNLSFKAKELSALPIELVQAAKDIAKRTKAAAT
ncbi:MAG: nucleotidyltransferase domain-containing protein [Pseudomonadota bacterium]